MQEPNDNETGILKAWSLIVFTFLTTISVVLIIASIIIGTFPDKILYLLNIIAAALSALFYIVKQVKAGRLMVNFKSTTSDREIAIFILYSVISIVTVLQKIAGLLIITSFIGLILLLVIDSVYLHADERKSIHLHSGQTFITALLAVSFFTGILIPFIFIATIKLISSFYTLSVNSKNDIIFSIRYFRIALLIVTGVSLVSGISYPGYVIFSLFLTGEFLDRVLFSIDIKQLNINRFIDQHINDGKDEKERN
jgi:hypothetical protein